MRCLVALSLVLIAGAPVLAAGRPMTVDDLLAVKSVSDPQISPDGKSVVYVVSEIHRETNKSNSDLWLVPVSGGEPRRLTTSPGTDNHPRWSPDGKQIAFVSDRGGSSQVWLLPTEGGEARPLTKLPIDVAGPIWSPRGDKLAFVAEVYPGQSPEETARKDKEKADSKSKVRVFDRLMVRHWTSWDEGKRSHLFVCDARTGEAKDLTPRLEVNTPPAPFGGSNEYSFSPDGKEIAFTAEPLKDHPWSTNTDIWLVPAEGGEAKNLTEDNEGADAQPAFRPGGGSPALAYVSQARAGFESDQWVLRVLGLAPNGPGPLVVAKTLDRSVLSFTWNTGIGSGGPTVDLYAVIDDGGYEPVVGVTMFDKVTRLLEGATYGAAQRAIGPELQTITGRPGGHPAQLVFLRHSANHPAEIYTSGAGGGEPRPLTHHNDELVAQLDLAKAEGFTFKGADDDDVSGWLIRPPGSDETKKYPVVFLIHGGPQGAFHDEWHNRWNYALFAAPGYAVVAINPRGSTGYGQKFTDQISKDWNGRVYEDLMKGLDFALKKYPFLDGSRMAAAGGSYGGFMVNWIAGHSDRFRALISHAGVFDLASMYGTTEELWFPEWEFGGLPWEHPEIYREQSPSSYVQNFQTPTLVIHGALDFRVPDAQGLGMFTALQRRGVPSRFVLFPDEGHWIAKPANRVAWWREVHDWLAKYLKPGDR